MAATMKDIARRTGLGLATISSYFNGGNVREKNRIKIEEAIEELHYEVNEVARGLKTNATKTVGVVIPELNNVFCAEIISGMEDILRSHGYAAIVCDCRTDKKLEKEAVDFLTRKRVDGIINMPVDMTGAHLNEFQKTGKPIVLIDRMIQGISCDCVLVDNVNAARQRMLGYMKALKDHGIAVDEKLICHGDYTIQGGVQAVEELVKENPDMTAVFVTNYEMTMGAVIGLNEMGVSMPEEISLVGFDNLPFARACRPALTIVSQPTEKIARETAQIMLERLEGREELPDHIVRKLQTDIFMGKSIRRQG